MAAKWSNVRPVSKPIVGALLFLCDEVDRYKRHAAAQDEKMRQCTAPLASPEPEEILLDRMRKSSQIYRKRIEDDRVAARDIRKND